MQSAASVAGEPRLRVDEFFAGRTRGSGLFTDRFGRLRRQFRIDAEGVADGDGLTLSEHIAYADGPSEERVWRIRPTGPDGYAAETRDLVGLASGVARGCVFNLSYRLNLALGPRRLTVRFDDWMYLQPDGLLINRAAVSKFGLLLGQITCVFWRLPAEPARPQSAAEALQD